MIFGAKEGKTMALAAVEPRQIRKMPIEHLGTMLKMALIKAEDGGAESLYIVVKIDRGDDD